MASTGQTLKIGSRGEVVGSLQKALNDILGTRLAVDGAFGKGTADAVKTFQVARGLPATGEADAATLQRLSEEQRVRAGGGGQPGASSAAASTSPVAPPAGSAGTGAPTGSATGSSAGGGPSPASATVGLRRGARGAAVQTLQASLNAVLNARLAVDGQFGPGVENAVKAFQRLKGLPQTGAVDQATADALDAAAVAAAGGGLPAGATQPGGGVARPKDGYYQTLILGDSGPKVTALQNALNQFAGATLKVTGLFDAPTQIAVRAFQKAQGLEGTGIADDPVFTRLHAMKLNLDKAKVPPGLTTQPATNAEPSAWEKLSSTLSSAWQDFAKKAVDTWNQTFAKDPQKAKPQVEQFVQDLEASRENLEAIKPLLPVDAKTEADKKILADYQGQLERYGTLASKFYADTQKANVPAAGFLPVLIALGVIAVGIAGASWAVASNQYAKNLRDQTALMKEDLEARVAASKEGRSIPKSNLPPLPSGGPLSGPPDPNAGAGVGTWLLIGGGLIALGGGAWWFFGRGRAA